VNINYSAILAAVRDHSDIIPISVGSNAVIQNEIKTREEKHFSTREPWHRSRSERETEIAFLDALLG